MKIVPIVEGHGEVAAVPVLLRRMLAERNAAIEINRPIRVPRNKLVKSGELERTVEFAARQCGSSDAILVLIDADDDCPARLGPSLLQRATTCRSDRTILVVLAAREFESWFLGGSSTLGGRRGLPDDLSAPDEPERIRDAKGWLSNQMRTRHPGGYRETLHQPAFAQVFDIAAARRACPSFDKFCRELDRL